MFSLAAISEIRSLAIAAVARFGLYSFASTFSVLSNCFSQGFISNSSFDFDSSVYGFFHSYCLVVLMDINVKSLFNLILPAPFSNYSHYSALTWMELFSYANFPFSFVMFVTLDAYHITHCGLNDISILFHGVSFTQNFKVLLLPSAPYCFFASHDMLFSKIPIVYVV